MNRKSVVRWFAGVATIAVLAATAGMSTANGAAQAGFTIHIGAVVPFTGASAVFGPAYAKAAGLAVQQAKAALKQAGINDVKIQIEYSDDGTTPEGGVNAARKMISKGADCILGALTSSGSIAIAQAATVPAASRRSGPTTRRLPHRPEGQRLLLPHDALGHPPGADPRELIQEEMGAGKDHLPRRPNDAFGTGSCPLKTSLQKLGMKTQGPLLYDPTAASYNSEADDIVKGNPMPTSSSTSRRTTRRSGPRYFAPGSSTVASCSSPAAGRRPSRRSSRPHRSRARGVRSRARARGRRPPKRSQAVREHPGHKDRQTLDSNNFDGA